MFEMTGPHQSLLRIINVLAVHLLLAHFCRGQFQLTGPPQPIVATMGDDIILPCHLQPGVDVAGKTLEWTRPELDSRYVFVWRAGQDRVNLKNPSYKGRTSVNTGELKHGNISLKLSNVKPSDGGRYKCYIPDLNTESLVELVVGAASSPSISLSEINRNKGAVVLQCESTGWYPEPEVFWLDGEGNLLSAGPTETVRGPDDLYTVSSRVTVEKRHSNSFTCRVQQNSTNQIRETKIHVPDDFFEVQSSSSSTTVGLAVSLAVCILVNLILGFLVWKFKTKRSHRDETDKRVKMDQSKHHNTKEEPERQQLLTHGTVQMKDLNEGQAAGIRPEQEQQRREEAENKVKIQKEDLETKKTELREKRSDLQQLHEEKQRKEGNVKRLKEQLENKKTEVETLEAELGKHSMFSWSSKEEEQQQQQQKKKEAEKEAENLKQQLETEEKELDTKTKQSSKEEEQQQQQQQKEAEKEVENLKQQLETEEKELFTKTKQFDKKQVKVQQLQEEIQKKETNLKTLMEELESNNKEPKWPLVTRQRFLEEQQKLKEQKQKLKEEQQRREEAENKVQTLEEELQKKTRERESEKQNSSPVRQNSTTEPAVVFRVYPCGEYVHLINTSTEDQQLGGWTLKIQVNDNEPIKHTFEDSFSIKTGQVFTVWCCGCGKGYPRAHLVLEDLKPWSFGDTVQVSLISSTGEIQYNLDRITESY